MSVPGYVYDDAITEALMRVARENEYTPYDDNVDEGKVYRYRNLYTSALSYVSGELLDYMLVKEQVIMQPVGDVGCPEGWGYLPLEFITFSTLGTRYNMTLHPENGKKIIQAVGSTISYIALPKFVDAIWYNIKEAIIYKFLYNCALIDAEFAKNIPVIMDAHSKTMQRAAIEMQRLNKNKQPDPPITIAYNKASGGSNITGAGSSLIRQILGK